jgi:hypothetical protein
MSLINCPGCGHEMSTEADACPKCGRPIFGIPDTPTVVYVTEPSSSEGPGNLAGQILLGLLFGGALIGLIYVFFVAPKEASQPQNANVYVVVPN